MTVRCKGNTKRKGLTNGQLYHVVAVAFNLRVQKVSYNIVDDDMTLAFYEGDLFDIGNEEGEIDWVIRKVDENYYSILPKILAYDSFYEDFHNDEPDAIAKFKSRFPDLYEKLVKFG